MKGFLDLDLGSAVSVSWSLESFLFTLEPMEKRVIFLRVFFSMVEVFSWGEVLPELEDLSAVLALELAVPELYSLLDTVTLFLTPEFSLVSLHSLPSLLLFTNFSSRVSSRLRSSLMATVVTAEFFLLGIRLGLGLGFSSPAFSSD